MTGTAKFLTIRQTAKLGLLSEYQLRLWQKQGKLPGIYTGNTFRVNVPMLERKLEEMSAQGGMEG
ncbi:MAG: hypothetical protein HFE95_01550 [Acutalibacter sp.]|jgi:hypothetical protein|nr:hypothetical protein [Acutalibacter sp.]